MKILRIIKRAVMSLLDFELQLLTIGITDSVYIDILSIDKGLDYQGSLLYINYGKYYGWQIDVLYLRYWYYKTRN